MRDDLCLIAWLQNTLKAIQESMSAIKGAGQTEEEKGFSKGAFFAFFQSLRYFYFSLTGNEWEDSPKELMNFCNQWLKDKAAFMENRN